MIRLGVIGLGMRSADLLAELYRADPEVRLVALADPSRENLTERFLRTGIPDAEHARLHGSAAELLEEADQLDGVVVGTRCSLHTPIALQVADTKLPLFLEKPVAIDAVQLKELATAFQGRFDSVVVSFPLRMTPLFHGVREIIASGTLGEINQIEATNAVPYGGVYFGQWYRNYDETGGLWLQKAVHDFDYLRLLHGHPRSVSAAVSQRIYGGPMPAGLRCSSCSLTGICPESPEAHAAREDDGGMTLGIPQTDDHWCAFGEDIFHQDAGSALLRYPDGSIATYAQNFIARRSAARRGATITGYRATLSFDWFRGAIRVVDHHTNRVVDKEVKATTGHLGGDTSLASAFLDLIHERAPASPSLLDGLASVAACLAARESSHNETVERVPTMEEVEAGTLPPSFATSTPSRSAGVMAPVRSSAR